MDDSHPLIWEVRRIASMCKEYILFLTSMNGNMNLPIRILPQILDTVSFIILTLIASQRT